MLLKPPSKKFFASQNVGEKEKMILRVDICTNLDLNAVQLHKKGFIQGQCRVTKNLLSKYSCIIAQPCLGDTPELSSLISTIESSTPGPSRPIRGNMIDRPKIDGNIPSKLAGTSRPQD
jgi:hypothetical protein